MKKPEFRQEPEHFRHWAKLVTELVRAVFYTYQNNGVCAGACASDGTHQMEKTDTSVQSCLNPLFQNQGSPF